MTPPPILARGITQQWSTTSWRATGYVGGIGWLETWGPSLITALEAARRGVSPSQLVQDVLWQALSAR